MASPRWAATALAREPSKNVSRTRRNAERPAGPRGRLHQVCHPVEHDTKTAGNDHLGLGSDFAAIEMTPVGLEDVSCYPYITQELLNRVFVFFFMK